MSNRLPDHTIGNEVSIAALGSGCSYFEKHFTIDKNLGS